MKIAYLVINHSDSKEDPLFFRPVNERFSVFDDFIKAKDKLYELGWPKPGEEFMMDFNLKPGFDNLYRCGDIHLSLVPLFVNG